MPPSDRTQPVLPAPLLKAARRLLRPLVRLMMQSGLTFPVLAETLRRLFVEIAARDILTDPKTRTDSRISLLTGVHRKEIRRLRELPPDPVDAPDIVTLVSQIVARWIGGAPFTDENDPPTTKDTPSGDSCTELTDPSTAGDHPVSPPLPRTAAR